MNRGFLATLQRTCRALSDLKVVSGGAPQPTPKWRGSAAAPLDAEARLSVSVSIRPPAGGFARAAIRSAHWQAGRCSRDVALLLVAASSVACSETATSREDARRVLLEGLGNEIFVPRYAEFEKRAQALEDATNGFCEAPTEAGLQDVQAAWWSSRAPWKRNELLAFGPYVDEPDRFGPSIDFWPARVTSIEAVLSDTAELTPAVVDSFGTTQKGFGVIEYLIYQPMEDTLLAFSETPRRCEYLVALSGHLQKQARGMRRAWDPAFGNYLGELVSAGRDSEAFDSLDMALGEVVNRLVFTVENLRGDKLGAPLGNRSAGTPQPDVVESRFSQRSLVDATDALKGVEEVCLGEKKGSASLAQYLVETLDRKDLVDALSDRFAESFDALDAVAEPLSTSVSETPADVQEAIDVLAELQRLIQTDVINTMGLTLTFNDADGD